MCALLALSFVFFCISAHGMIIKCLPAKKLNAGIEMDKISLNQHVEIERYIVVGKYYPSEKTNYHTYIIGIPDEN